MSAPEPATTTKSSYHYLGGADIHTGIYVALIERLREQGLTVNFVGRVKVSPNPLSWWRAWRNRHMVGPNPAEVVRRRLPGSLHVIPIWSLWSSPSALPLMRALGLPRSGRDRLVVHGRQWVMTRLALVLKRWWPRMRVISEIEGDILAEIDYVHASSPRSWLGDMRYQLERRFYIREEYLTTHRSDALVVVTNRLRDVLARRNGLTVEETSRIHVFPTGASRKEFQFDAGKRAATRAALGIDDRLVIVYNGNLSTRWQVPEKLVEVFNLVRARRPDAFFLVLAPSSDWARIRPLLDRAGIAAADHRVLECEHGKMRDHLDAADVGLLLRDRHPMNEAGAPSKFCEYLMSGLPIVLTEGIGDYSDAVKDQPFACVLPSLDDLAGHADRIVEFCGRNLTPEQRAEISRWAGERFATELWIPKLAELYRTV